MTVLRSVPKETAYTMRRDGQAMHNKKALLLLLLLLLSGLGACREKNGKEPMIEEVIDPAHPEGEPVYGGEEDGGESSPTPAETYP